MINVGTCRYSKSNVEGAVVTVASIHNPCERSWMGSIARSAANTRCCSGTDAARTSSIGVARIDSIIVSRVRWLASQKAKSERSVVSMTKRIRPEGGCGGDRADFENSAGTTRISLEQRDGNCRHSSSAEGAPAEPPKTATRETPIASSRHACACPCAAGETSSGAGVRR
jgi:hypothetical protein